MSLQISFPLKGCLSRYKRDKQGGSNQLQWLKGIIFLLIFEAEGQGPWAGQRWLPRSPGTLCFCPGREESGRSRCCSEAVRHPSPAQQGLVLVTGEEAIHLTRVVNCTVSDVKRTSQTVFGKSRDCLCWGRGKGIHSSLQWVKQFLPLR